MKWWTSDSIDFTYNSWQRRTMGNLVYIAANIIDLELAHIVRQIAEGADPAETWPKLAARGLNHAEIQWHLDNRGERMGEGSFKSDRHARGF